MRETGKLIYNAYGDEEPVYGLIEDNTGKIINPYEKKEALLDWHTSFARMQEIAESWKEVYPYQDETAVNLNRITEYPRLPYLIYWGSDWHIGNVDTRYEELKKDIRLITTTPNCGVVTVGDDIDNGIMPKFEVRFMQTSPPMVQAFTMASLIDELNGNNPRRKQTILAHVIGNHTHTMMETTGQVFEKYYERSKAAILPGIGRLGITLGKQSYEIALAHRYVGTSRLNVTLCAKRLMEYVYPDADVAVVGHSHVSAHEKFKKGGMWHTAVRPGTYRVGTGLFEHARSYSSGDIGGSCTIFYPDKHDALTFDRLEEGIDYLQNIFVVKGVK